MGGTDEENYRAGSFSKTMREVGEVLGWLGLRLNSSDSGVAVQQNLSNKVAPNSVISVVCRSMPNSDKGELLHPFCPLQRALAAYVK